jgi:hypothetical protein
VNQLPNLASAPWALSARWERRARKERREKRETEGNRGNVTVMQNKQMRDCGQHESSTVLLSDYPISLAFRLRKF